MLNNVSKNIAKNIKTFIMIIILVLIWMLFTIFKGDRFLNAVNFSNLFRQMTIISFITIGMVLVIVTGNIDLSVGSVVGFLSMLAAFLQYYVFSPLLPVIFPGIDVAMRGLVSTILTVILCLGAGLLVGLFQGAMVAYLGIPAFIVTLGGMFIFRGGLLALSQSKTIGPVEEPLRLITQGYLTREVGWVLGIIVVGLIFLGTLWRRRNKKLFGFELQPLHKDLLKAGFFALAVLGFVFIMNLDKGRALSSLTSQADREAISNQGVPYPVLLMGIVAVIVSYLSSNTRFGRYAYAIGGNKEAARLAGINIKRNILKVFILMGILCGVAGIVLTGRVAYGTTSGGLNFELSAIAGCVIGGTSLMGGEGTVLGALVGALIMTSLDNGMSIMDLGPEWQYIIKGAVLVMAAYIDVTIKKKK